MDEPTSGDQALTSSQRVSVADQLVAAGASRTPADPPTRRFPEMTLDDAYAIQLDQISRRLANGSRVVGHKVGLTSAAMQTALGVDQPDFGHLLDDMVHDSFAPIDCSAFLQPRVEPEVAFILGRRLEGPGVTTAEAFTAIDVVLPALEIIDSRIRDWEIEFFDTIADNASSGGVVLGGRAVRPSAVDLRLVGCNLHQNGELVHTGAAGAVLGDPIHALVWLANTLGRRDQPLEAGEIILPGSCTAAVPVVAGDTVTASFGGLGTVSATFTEESR